MAALALLATTACRDGGATPADTAAAPALVLGAHDVAVATEGEVGAVVELSGPLEPREQVTLRAQVSGTVVDLRVDRGSAVGRGQRLARIRASGVESQAAGARAQVAAAEAGLAVARQRRDAAERLAASGAMSEVDRRGASAAFEAAEAQLAAARAQAAAAREAAGYTSVEAPIAGVVSARRVESGEAVSPGGELLTIVNARVLELRGTVGVVDAGRVRVGQPVRFALDALPAEQFTGRVARIDPVADRGTRQVGVYVELANPGGRIVGGQFARGRIATGVAARGVLIPQAAVQRATPEATTGFVLVVEDGRLVRREVVLGAIDEASGSVLVQRGLRAGDRVVSVPAPEAREGARVTIAGDREG